MIMETTLPIQVDAYGRVTIAGSGIHVETLLAFFLRALEAHAKVHPDTPCDFTCDVLGRTWSHEFCRNYPYISRRQAKEALGFALQAILRLALARPEGVLLPALKRETKRYIAEPLREHEYK